MRRFIRFLALASLLPLGACSAMIGSEAPGSYRFRPSPREETALFAPTGPEWGLALSGGGIRSSLFSMGVMKFMYERGWLDSVQVVSTVSGGGYTAYWLYTREMRQPMERRFEQTFRPDSFRVALCEVMTRGNFVTYPQMFRAAINPFSGPRTLYERSLLRTFGEAEGDSPVQLHDLRPRTLEHTLPYLIVNTTVHQPAPRRGWAEGLYEFTPVMHGNDAWGYSLWDSTSIGYLKAASISGAAFKGFLQQRLQLSTGSKVMADGGHSENLGAVALIRRRVRNIVILDGVHDPDYEFGAYHNLKTRLERWGYRVEIPSLDSALPLSRGERLATGVHEGWVTSLDPSDRYTGRIIYVKLSLPRSLDSALTDSPVVERGDTVHERIFAQLNRKAAPDGSWNCDSLGPMEYSERDWFVFLVHHYSLFNPEGVRRRRGLAGIHKGLGVSFPHITTFDQSLYLDQSGSLVGLGYLIAERELEAAMRR